MRKILSFLTAILFAGSMMATDYQKVTSTADLVAGAKYVIGTDAGSFMSTTSNASNRRITTAEVTDGVVTATEAMMVFTLGGEADAWTFATDNYLGTAGYLNATNTTGSNYLKVVAELDQYAYFTVAIEEGVTTITCNGKESRHILYQNGSTCFACYNNQTSSQYSKPNLYKEVAGGEGGDDPQPEENMTVYFVNVPGWEAVNAYVWGTAGSYQEWPGEAMTKLADQINEKDVYSYTFPASMVNIIFNNGTNQTNDLVVNAAKPYYYGNAWYALEEIPTEGGEGGDDPQPEENMTVYFVNVPGWDAVNAYVWGAAGSYQEWPGEAMTKLADQINEKDVYSYTFPASMVNIIFNNAGAQTTDLTVNAAKPYFYGDAWYALDEIPTEGGEGGDDPVEPTLANGFYLIGQNGWTVAALNADLKFAVHEGDEYVLTATLAENDPIKVVKVENDVIVGWYPDGEGTEYTVDAAHAGEKDIYFQEAYKADWSEFGGYFWMGENQVVPVADFTQPFVLKFNGTGESGKDASAAFAADVAAIFDAASAPYVASVETATKVYAGRPIADDNSSVKFGTTSAQGTLAFTLAQAIEVDSIIVNATQYGNNAAKVTVNGVEFDLNAGNKVPQDCKITPEDAVSAISIAQSGTERIYLRNIRIYPKAEGGEGGDDPVVVETKDIQVVPGAWAEYKLGAWAWSETLEGAWYAVALENEQLIAKVPVAADHIIIATFAADAELNWDNKIAQTSDLEIAECGVLYINDGTPTWCEEAQGGDDPQPATPKFYVVGNEVFAGENAWNPTAIPSMTDTLVHMAGEGVNVLRLSLDGSWDDNQQRDFRNLTEVADGLSEDIDNYGNHNIKFELQEAGNVTIIYNETTFKLEGDFYVAPEPTYEYADGYYLIGLDMMDWNMEYLPKEGRLFAQNPDDENEYQLTITLAEEQQFKVVRVYHDEIADWYPQGMDNNYIVDAAHAGEKTVYFRPNYSGGQDWHEACIYVAANEDQPEETNYIVKWDADAEQVIGQVIYHAAAATASTKIHGNQDNVTAINLSSSYKYASDQYVVIKPATGTFKAGDKVSFNTFINNGTTDGSKYGAVYFYAADGATVLFQGQNGINGRVSEDDPAVENFTLEADQDSILFGRYGNTATYVSVLYVTREGGEGGDPVVVETKDIQVVPGAWAEAKLAAWAWTEGSEGAWYAVSMENEQLIAKVPVVADHIIIAAFAADAEIDWSSDHSQTANLTINDCGILYINDGSATWCEPAEQQETITLYYVNNNNWENVYAYVFNGKGEYIAWPGEAATATEMSYNDMTIYSYTFPATYTTIIFNNNNNEGQTTDLVIDATKPYFYNTEWFASVDDIHEVATPHFYIVGNAALVGEELAENPGAIKVMEDNYTFENLAADIEYTLKISLDGTHQTKMGFSNLTDTAENLHTDAYDNIVFSLAEAGNVTVTYIPATETTPYVFTVTGSFVPYVEPTHTYTVAGPEAIFVSNWDPEYAANDMVKQEDGTYKWEQEGFEFAAGTIEFKVCKDHSWNPSYPGPNTNYVLNIPEDGIYTLTIYFNPAEESINAVATKTGEKEFDPTITYYLVGLNGDFTTKLEEYKLTETSDVEGQFEVAVTLALGDEFKILAAQEGHQDVYFPDGLNNNYVVDAAHAGEKTVYFRPDYNGGEGWFAGCIYVPANEGTNIDNVNAAVEAVKIFRNGQLLIIKGEKTYTIMGQVVK